MYWSMERFGSSAAHGKAKQTASNAAGKPRSRKIFKMFNYYLGVVSRSTDGPIDVNVHANRFDAGRRHSGCDRVLRYRMLLRFLIPSANGPKQCTTALPSKGMREGSFRNREACDIGGDIVGLYQVKRAVARRVARSADLDVHLPIPLVAPRVIVREHPKDHVGLKTGSIANHPTIRSIPQAPC